MKITFPTTLWVASPAGRLGTRNLQLPTMDNKTGVPHKKHNKFLMGLAMNLFVIDGNCQI